MKVTENKLEKNFTTISALELKQLLILLSKSSSICFRVRQLGEMWMTNLMRVHAVNEKSVLLYDENETKYYLVRLNNIMQFEIDARFQTYQPFFHYNVLPSRELD